MALLNTGFITGRLTSEPTYTTQGDTVITEFSIAHNRGRNRDPYFFDVVAFGENDQEYVKKNLKKGKEVTVQYALRFGKWSTEQGNRTKVDLVAQTIQLGADAQNSSDAASDED